MLNRHPKVTASALIVCCLLFAALGAAWGQDAPKPASQSAAPEGGGQPDQTPTMPNPSPQATEKSPTPERPSDATGRITVQLIQVRSDWSKGKDPEGTKKTLETVLKDVALPENYRSNLLGSASRILFPEDFAGGYRPEQLASLLAWMKQRDLVRIDLPPKPLLPDLPHEGRSSLSPGTCRLFAGEDIVPVSATRERLDPPPFFKRTYGWEWHCMSRLQTDGTTDQTILELGIQRFRAFRDDPQVDGQSPRLTAASDGTPIGITLPINWAGVVRCFGPADEMSEQIQLQDWEPLLVIAYGAAETREIETPKLAAPASLLELGEPRVLASKKLAEVFQLANTQATELGPLLQGVISNGRLVADKDKNSLLAYGTRTELDTLKALLAKLEAAPTAPPYSSGPERAAPPAPAAEADQQVNQVAVFHLKHADLSQVIRALAAVSSGLRAEVDDLGGSLTVMGTKDDLAAVENLLKELDQPRAPQSPDAIPTHPEEKQLKIFHLVHARANQMAAILRQLFPEITMSGDERTNSLIAQGEQRRLEAAEAVIQKLDETPSEKQEPPLDEASRRHILETASGEFAAAEAEIQSIVESIAGEADKKKAEQLRARLTGLVAEAFDLRQKLQRAELALLKERVGIIESRLGQRDSLRDEIIQRRVKSLLAGGTPLGETAGVATNRPPAAGAAAEQLAANVRPDDDKDGSAPIAWGSDEDIRSRTREQRLATWQKAYGEQRARNPWPAQLSPQFHAAVKGTLGDEDMMAIPLLEEYQVFVERHAPRLDMIVDRRRPKQPAKIAPGAEPQGNMTPTEAAPLPKAQTGPIAPNDPRIESAP